MIDSPFCVGGCGEYSGKGYVLAIQNCHGFVAVGFHIKLGGALGLDKEDIAVLDKGVHTSATGFEPHATPSGQYFLRQNVKAGGISLIRFAAYDFQHDLALRRWLAGQV